MINKTKMKIQKPTKYDIHLQYRCPDCCNIHWLSFLESSTKNFKVVCDCSCVFKVKRITGFKVKYNNKKKKQQGHKNTEKFDIPSEVLDRAIQVLLPYGFSRDESKDLITRSYIKNPTEDILLLVKNSLEILKNEHCAPI